MEKKNPFGFHNYDNRGKLFSKLSRRHLLSNNYLGKKAANSLEVKKNPLKLPPIPSLQTSVLQPVILFMTCFLSLCPFFSIHYIQESKTVLELLHVASSWDSSMHWKAELQKVPSNPLNNIQQSTPILHRQLQTALTHTPDQPFPPKLLLSVHSIVASFPIRDP